jgi:hypothetical protein
MKYFLCAANDMNFSTEKHILHTLRILDSYINLNMMFIYRGNVWGEKEGAKCSVISSQKKKNVSKQQRSYRF